MKMPFTVLHVLAMTGLMLFSRGLIASPSKSDAPAAATDMSAELLLYNKDNQDCSLIAEKAGYSAFMFACDYSPDKVIVKKMPSQATVLLSEGECTESKEKSKWWVRLQATARETSSAALPMQSILSVALQWLNNPSMETYAAPYLKIIGAGISDPGNPRINCSIVQLPATQPNDILFTAPQSWKPHDPANDMQCGQNVLLAAFWRVVTFDYQCAQLKDASEKPLLAYDSETITVHIYDPPKFCPGGKIVTGMKLSGSGVTVEKAILTCARFKTETGRPLNVAAATEGNRWVNTDKHNTLCERPTTQGSAFLLSSPNRFMTGLGLGYHLAQWHCAEATLGAL